MADAAHPLDRAVWNALTTRRAAFAIGDSRARRVRADIGLFVAAADETPASLAALAALVPDDASVGSIEPRGSPVPPGCSVVTRATLVQMVAPAPIPADRSPATAIVALTDADAPAMLDLATRTKPGPFFAGTHLLGGFLGVKHDGALVAMAGTRLSLPGYVEISAVCTDPAYRGHGYAAMLMTAVADAIRDGGDMPFLTSYADNAGAIALYEKLGYRIRRELDFTILTRNPTHAQSS